MNDINDILKKINIEEFIWIIYLIIIYLSFYSNKLERKYYLYDDHKAKNTYRNINIIIFFIAFLVYIYFFIDGYKSINNLSIYDDSFKRFLNEISFVASTLILIAGSIFLFIAIYDINLDTEIAFS